LTTTRVSLGCNPSPTFVIFNNIISRTLFGLAQSDQVGGTNRNRLSCIMLRS
jgi:hypothetical protein